MNVLVFAPHPDDDVIGCGGVIAKHKKIDDFVTVVYLTSGGLTDDPAIREQEAINAEKILGADKLKFLKWKDHEVYPTTENRSKIIDVLKEFNPRLIYCPSPQEQHQDHVATFKLVSRAVNTHLYLYEVYPGIFPIETDDYEDITDVLGLKVAALKEFKSQGCNLSEAYRCHARFRGIMSGVGDFCEVFKKHV